MSMMNMTKKACIFLLIAILSLLGTYLVIHHHSKPYKLHLIRQDNGWGYEISVNNTLIIHQPYIPAVSGNHSFDNRSLARKTGKLVIEKLKNNKPPYISPEELESIGIMPGTYR